MIRRRTDTYETKTGQERWLVSYSDFITLLFAFFVVMYSVSQVSEEKYRVLSSTLSSAFDGKVPVDAILAERLQTIEPTDTDAITGISPFARSPTTQDIAKQLQQALVKLANPADVSIRATADWVEIEIKANLLFDSASADPSSEAQNIFRQVAGVLAEVPNPVEVAGHTDDIPINTAQFQSNWELSSARASSVVRLLAQGGIEPVRLSAVGYGEFRPVVGNSDAAERAQNRRVVLKVSRSNEQTPVLAPMQSFDPAALVFGEAPSDAVPTEQSVAAESSDISDTDNRPPVAPVRLNHGGLLFTSDPELPRKNP